jgi:hypothetical protein
MKALGVFVTFQEIYKMHPRAQSKAAVSWEKHNHACPVAAPWTTASASASNRAASATLATHARKMLAVSLQKQRVCVHTISHSHSETYVIPCRIYLSYIKRV